MIRDSTKGVFKLNSYIIDGEKYISLAEITLEFKTPLHQFIDYIINDICFFYNGFIESIETKQKIYHCGLLHPEIALIRIDHLSQTIMKEIEKSNESLKYISLFKKDPEIAYTGEGVFYTKSPYHSPTEATAISLSEYIIPTYLIKIDDFIESMQQAGMPIVKSLFDGNTKMTSPPLPIARKPIIEKLPKLTGDILFNTIKNQDSELKDIKNKLSTLSFDNSLIKNENLNLKSQILDLEQQLNKAKESPDQPSRSALKLIAGLVKSYWSMDIHTEPFNGFSELARDIALKGIKIDDKTLRNLLRQAADATKD